MLEFHALVSFVFAKVKNIFEIFKRNACGFKKLSYLCIAFETKRFSQGSFGEMAEWSIAAVLKTVVLRGTGGSNPSLSARVL